jgi:hypothetical protein
LTICRMATSTEKRQKVGLFQRFFHPSMSIFPRFPTFPALSNFYSRKYIANCWCINQSTFYCSYRNKI